MQRDDLKNILNGMKASLLLVLGLMVTLAAQAQGTVDHIYNLEWVDSLTPVQAPQYQVSLQLSSQEWGNGINYSPYDPTTHLAYPNSLVVYSPLSWRGPGSTLYVGGAIQSISWTPVNAGGYFQLYATQEDDMHLQVGGFYIQPSGIDQWMGTGFINETIYRYGGANDTYARSGIFQIARLQVPEPHAGALIAGMTTLFLILQKIRRKKITGNAVEQRQKCVPKP